ncbi:MAG: SGNH/GDSL hydrolase family protein, partial [Kiritimatiellae bacterium]|nr:SGNH/GDSL hydrolase family protein [Kiritimatiellia bacterium]
MRRMRRRLLAKLAATGIAGGMALSALADRTVSENLTLTRDLDWSGDVVTVADGVTVDLNGHVLKVAGLDGSTAASGVVTSSNGGELRFVIPAGTTNTLGKTRLAGNLRVFKEGPGGLVLGLSGQTYSGGTEVVEGTLSPTTTGANTPFGASYSEVRVDAGGVLDFKGCSNFVNYQFNLYGGRLHNSGGAIGTSLAIVREINLYADSTVSGNQFGILGPSYALTYLNLNRFTLSVEMTAQSTYFHICHGMIGEGTIHLKRGTLYFYGSGSKYRVYAEKTDIVGEVGTSIYNSNNGYLHARSITTKGHMTGGNWFYVERYVHDVPEGVVSTNKSALGVASPNQLVVSITKKGKGVLALGNSNNGNLTNGIFATEGCVKLIQNKALGKDKVNPVVISAGATIDANGISGGSTAGSLSFAGDGWDGNGAIQNSGASQDYYYAFPITAVGMTLTGHASIGGTGDFGFVNPSYSTNTLNLGSYTLTKKGPNHVYLAATTVAGTGPLVVAEGALGAMGTCVVNPPVIVKSGAALDLAVASPRGKVGDLTLKDCMMEPGSTILGSAAGSALNLAGTFTGAASFPCTNLVLKAGATLVLPAGASQFTCAGRFSVADVSAVLDVSALFANGEPAGNEVTILTAGGVGGIPTIRGAAGGWTPVKTGTSLKLAKGAAEPTTLPSLSSEVVCVDATTVFDIPASLGATLEPGVYTLASWNVCATGYGAPQLKIAGCPYETELLCGNYDVKLHVKSAAESAAKPVRIWAVGDDRVEGNGGSWRIPLAQKLSLDGWNVQMTGARTAYAAEPSGATTRDAWRRHTGVPSLAIKTTPSQSGLLEGLETHCAAAQEPDFTILQIGTFDYWATNHYYNAAQAAAHWREACDRILAALPDTVLVVTTVMTDTYTGLGWNDANYSVQKATRTALNAAIREQVALDEANGGFPAGRVALVDLDQLIAPTTVDWSNNWRQTPAGCALVADALRAKLLTLGTAAGKN